MMMRLVVSLPMMPMMLDGDDCPLLFDDNGDNHDAAADADAGAAADAAVDDYVDDTSSFSMMVVIVISVFNDADDCYDAG